MRKRKKAGRYTNRSGNTAKKVEGSQLEWWTFKASRACQYAYNLYNAYRGYEIIKSLIEQYLLST